MSIFDEQKPAEFIKSEPSNINSVQNFAKLTVGAGSEKFEVSSGNGLFMGAETYDDAPVQIGFDGKFVFGDKDGGKYIEYNGTTMTVRGALNADDITAGTISGRTIKANGGSSGADIWIDSSDGKVKFRYNNTEKGYLTCASDGSVYLHGAASVLIDSDSGVMVSVSSGGNLGLTGDDGVIITYNDDGGSDVLSIFNDTTLVAAFNDSNNLDMNGHYVIAKYAAADGTIGKTGPSTYGFVTAVESSRAKFREFTVQNGLITSVSSESSWV